jgi:hypothetical protein
MIPMPILYYCTIRERNNTIALKGCGGTIRTSSAFRLLCLRIERDTFRLLRTGRAVHCTCAHTIERGDEEEE